MKILLLSVLIFAFFSGCADDIIKYDPVDKDLKIEITSPVDNDSLGFKGEKIDYLLKDISGFYFIELYVNNDFIRNYPPVNNTNPIISFEIDSSFLGKRIELFLIIYATNGVSYKSNTVKNVLITEDKTLPSAPVDLQVFLLSSTSLNLSWKDNSPYIQEYEIWRREGLNGNFTKYLSVAGDQRNVNDDNLAPGIVYYYKVRGVSRNGISDFSKIISSDGSGGSQNIPAPGNLKAVVKDFRIIGLTWTDNSTNENYFKIERRRPWSSFEAIGYTAVNSESFTDSSSELIGGAEYFYRVKAVSGSDSSWSNEVYVFMPPYLLKAPTIISVTNPSSRSVLVKWRDNDQQWAGFIVEKKTDGGNFSEAGRVEGSVLSFRDTVQPGKNYYYRVKQDDGIYSSNYSDEVGILTQVVPLTAPFNVNGYFDGINMILAWEYNLEADWFVIEKRDSTAGGSFNEVGLVQGNLRQFADDNTICQHTYVYRLRAKDPYMDSPYSPEKAIKNWNNCP